MADHRHNGFVSNTIRPGRAPVEAGRRYFAGVRLIGRSCIVSMPNDKFVGPAYNLLKNADVSRVYIRPPQRIPYPAVHLDLIIHLLDALFQAFS